MAAVKPEISIYQLIDVMRLLYIWQEMCVSQEIITSGLLAAILDFRLPVLSGSTSVYFKQT